jgi:hypothetical protein
MNFIGLTTGTSITQIGLVTFHLTSITVNHNAHLFNQLMENGTFKNHKMIHVVI